jgi:hypothetical protein
MKEDMKDCLDHYNIRSNAKHRGSASKHIADKIAKLIGPSREAMCLKFLASRDETGVCPKTFKNALSDA